AEPLAAALAVCEIGIARTAQGLVCGRGRIATLTARLLRLHGYAGFQTAVPGSNPNLPSCEFDVIVETEIATCGFAALIDALRPGGTLILKNRPERELALNVAQAVRKNITLRGAAYGDFSRAVQLLVERPDLLAELVGEQHRLVDFAPALALARASES